MKIIDGTIATPKGFHADGIHCGLKKKKKDLGLIYSDTVAQAAAVFTTNQVKAAPIFVTKEAIMDGQLQAILVNSGNANACTGNQGLEDAQATQEYIAEKLEISHKNIAVASTGIIGKLLDMEKIQSGIEQLSEIGGNATGFAEAILTTDTTKKEVVVEAEIGGALVKMAGVAKGSGMIHPNMATMLSFITTDAAISSQLLQELLAEKTEVTFNQITVDGDTSTNDMVVVLANGQAGNTEIQLGTSDYEIFRQMFHCVCGTLAKMIAKDGEGATKLIEVEVSGALDTLSARMIAKKVVGSSLVKTAIFGSDPNWGRIICAVGYSDVVVNPMTIDISLGNQLVLKDSQPVDFDKEAMQEELAKETVFIKIDLKQGEASGMAWGCDLTYKYVEINALYHT
ncbi:MAG: bifunctional ornithine acetyltransferase/N-acetylglutamate synthase [Lactobacillales bacterium]|jgi:glutamate N-acetyltransferase/amino-acid N-acetyltransferase|nr:bifunctional ornithine acetyltransferase/N-acetylglutamate synthase [Lactobacillales bacterium]